MVTNTPVGVLRAVVILPSCLDFMVVHRLLRQTSTWRDNGRNELVTEDCAWITGNSEVNAVSLAVRPSTVCVLAPAFRGPDRFVLSRILVVFWQQYAT